MAHHILFQGGLGAGKTFGMVLLAQYFKELAEARGASIQLFSNFDVRGSMMLENYEDWYEVARAHGSICMWDEAHMAFSNRQWSRHGNEIATQVMMYTRKMQSVQMYATPSINNVDSRIRQIIELLVTMRYIPNKGFRFLFTDYQTGEHLRTVFFSMAKAKKIFSLRLYDTHQMVRAFPLPRTEKESEKFFDTLEEIHNLNRRKMVI